MTIGKMNLFNVLIVICVSTTVATAINEMHMSADIVKYFDKPTYVAAMNVWKPSENLQFANLLMKNAGSTVLFVNNIETMDRIKPAKDVLFLLDLNFPNLKIFLKYANATEKFRNPYRWLIIGASSNATLPPDIFNNIQILVDSEVLLASAYKENNAFLLNLIYKRRTRKNWIMEYFGTWKANEGLTVSANISSTSTAMRRKDLQQEVIKSVSIGKSAINFKSSRTELNDIIAVASYWQLVNLFDFLNASHEIIFFDSWGYKNNGTWTGILGGMAHGEVEIAAVVMYVTKARMEVVSYLAQPLVGSVLFVFREPRLSYQNNLFLLPFRADVWNTMIGFTVLIILVLYCTSMWELRKSGKEDMLIRDGSWLQPDFSDITIFAFSAIAQQGNASELKGGRGRIVIFLLLLLCLFLYTSYSASIVVLLQSSSDQIRTLTDLLNSKLELGVDDTPYNKYYFSTATEPVKKAIYNQKIAPKGAKPKFMSMEEGVRKLQKEPFAFNMFTRIGYKVIEAIFLEHEKCGLREIAYIEEMPAWYSCKKTSHYKEIFKVGLARLKEHGIFSRVSNQFYSKKPVCSVRGGSFVSVNIVDFYPALLVLVYGALGSLLLLAVELLLHRRAMRLTATRDDAFL